MESGIINRKKLGDIVFNDSEKLRILNNITHPEIYRITKDLIEKQSGVVFVEVPLLFETNFTSLVDKIIVISADEKIQIKRLKKRNKITTNEAINLINKQMSLNEKARLADYVIDNSSTIKHMERQVLNLLEKENLR